MKVGAAFSDSIYTQKPKFFHGGKREYRFGDLVTMRGFLLPIFFVVLAIILLGRLLFLQIIQGESFRVLSDTNRTRTTDIHAPRGVIFDRNHIPLVFNTPGYRRVVSGKINLVSNNDAMSLLAHGQSLEIDSLRYYPYKDIFAHVVGYIGQITPDDLQLPEFSHYLASDVIGKEGIEQNYENLLKGVDGKKLVEVDATGKVIRTLGQTDPIPGQNLTLTLDVKIQESAYEAMKDVAKGAAIVSSPKGDILALVSKPSFDPNLFTMGEHYIASDSGYTKVSQVLLDNDGQPLLDRAIGGMYPPGSTFKLLTAAAGLQTNTIDSNYTVEDDGILKVGDFSFANWYYTEYGKTEGQVDITKAIKRSNDIFFYKLADLVGVDKISAIASEFGVGKKLGIDLAGERSGLLPTRAWKQKTLGEQWYLGDNYHYGIGQGYLLTTPLQVNGWTQALANSGTLYRPHLLTATTSQSLQSNLLTSTNMELIRQGMIAACQKGGVAWPLFNFTVKNQSLKARIDGKDFLAPLVSTGSAALSSDSVGVSIACKTGTAQHGDDNTLPHAWITLFAPAYHPQIVVTVLSETSGEGSNVAGPVAEKILRTYFEKKN